MDPQHEQNQPQPQSEPPIVQPPQPTLVQTPLDTPQKVEASARDASKKSRNKLWGLVLLIGPSALLILAILLYALTNLMMNSQPETGDLFPQPTPLSTFTNIFLFLVGGLSVITWLPGIIIGIILLNKK